MRETLFIILPCSKPYDNKQIEIKGINGYRIISESALLRRRFLLNMYSVLHFEYSGAG